MDYKTKLQELIAQTPEQLWEMFPERVISEAKIMVETDKANSEPELVYTQFVAYLQIPKRKPWIVKKLIKDINQTLNPSDATHLENIQSN